MASALLYTSWIPVFFGLGHASMGFPYMDIVPTDNSSVHGTARKNRNDVC